MKKLLYIILIPALFGSCVQFEDSDYFDKSASVRIQEALDNTRAILVNAENGWFGDYYPAANHSIGGYGIYLKFSADGTVDVKCEVATNVPARQQESSLFAMTAEQGPVLSFNTYNKVMHYFSEPLSSSQTSGRAGDYEFIVLSASADKVVLKGKKRGNRMTLYRNSANIDPDSYLLDCSASNAAVGYASFKFVVNNIERGSATVTDRTYLLSYSNDSGADASARISYAFVPEGVRLYEPFVFDNYTIELFKWNQQTRRLECAEPAGVNIYLEAEGLAYNDFLGTYTMSYAVSNVTPINRSRTTTVTFEPAALGSTYYIKGILSPADEALGNIVARFSGRYGIELLGQIIFTRAVTDYIFWWLPYSSPINGNYTTRSTTAGMNGSDLTYTDANDISFSMVDNGIWTGYGGTAGFILRNYDSAGNNMGNVNGSDGQYMYFYPAFAKQ